MWHKVLRNLAATMLATALGFAAHLLLQVPKPATPWPSSPPLHVFPRPPRNSQQLLPCLQKSSSHVTCSLKSPLTSSAWTLPSAPALSQHVVSTRIRALSQESRVTCLNMDTCQWTMALYGLRLLLIHLLPQSLIRVHVPNLWISQFREMTERKERYGKQRVRSTKAYCSEPSHLGGPRWKVKNKNGKLHLDKALYHPINGCKLCLHNNKDPMYWFTAGSEEVGVTCSGTEASPATGQEQPLEKKRAMLHRACGMGGQSGRSTALPCFQSFLPLGWATHLPAMHIDTDSLAQH